MAVKIGISVGNSRTTAWKGNVVIGSKRNVVARPPNTKDYPTETWLPSFYSDYIGPKVLSTWSS